jgi:hypothetical protein
MNADQVAELFAERYLSLTGERLPSEKKQLKKQTLKTLLKKSWRRQRRLTWKPERFVGGNDVAF